jgi:hypothetical protein
MGRDYVADTVRKGGQMLIDMKERRELAGRGGDGSNQYAEQTLRSVTIAKPLTLQQVGFTGPMAMRWQLAARAPDDLVAEADHWKPVGPRPF